MGGGGQGRYYDPAAGRFNTQDPIGLDGGDPNLYRYVGNDPVNGIDPSGNQEEGVSLQNGSIYWILPEPAGGFGDERRGSLTIRLGKQADLFSVVLSDLYGGHRVTYSHLKEQLDSRTVETNEKVRFLVANGKLDEAKAVISATIKQVVSSDPASDHLDELTTGSVPGNLVKGQKIVWTATARFLYSWGEVWSDVGQAISSSPSLNPGGHMRGGAFGPEYNSDIAKGLQSGELTFSDIKDEIGWSVMTLGLGPLFDDVSRFSNDEISAAEMEASLGDAGVGVAMLFEGGSQWRYRPGSSAGSTVQEAGSKLRGKTGNTADLVDPALTKLLDNLNDAEKNGQTLKSLSGIKNRASTPGETAAGAAENFVAPRSGLKLFDKAGGLYRQGKVREALDVQYEDLVRHRTGGTGQVVNGREFDVVTSDALIPVKRTWSALDNPRNFLGKSTRNQIKSTIVCGRGQVDVVEILAATETMRKVVARVDRRLLPAGLWS